VNWPKLNTPAYAVEGYQDALNKVGNDPLLGQLVGHTTARGDGRLAHLEEGKKRRE